MLQPPIRCYRLRLAYSHLLDNPLAEHWAQALLASEQAQRRQIRPLPVAHPDHHHGGTSSVHHRPMPKQMAIHPPRRVETDHVCHRRLLGHLGISQGNQE